MGLDMYLSVKKYIPKYDWAKMSVNDDFNNLIENADYKILKSLLAPNLGDDDSSSGFKVEIPVGYWRKANAIHKFFVDECADGVDECQPINIIVDELIVLRDKCKTILENPSSPLANDLLPTAGGFFFGSTEYDEWYYRDLTKTVEIIDKVLAENDIEHLVIIYQASW